MEALRKPPAPNRDELVALGLLDPAAPDAHDRELLLQFLLARGATLDELRHSNELGDLVGASIDQTLRPGPRLSRREVAWRTAMDDDVLVQLRQAMGLPDPGVQVAFYTEADVLAARAFERLSLLFSEAVALQLMRVAGAALSRIAEASVSAFAVNVEAPLRAAGTTDVSMGRAFAEVASALPDLGRLLDVQLRHHVEAAIHQFMLTSNGTVSDTHKVTVGFVDIVGSTAWARSLAPSVHAARLQRFAQLAGDVVSGHGGRLVKLIGDEAMFVVADAGAACRIALEFVERCAATREIPQIRAGLATGDVISRDGDYHGEVVNLAARIVKCAEPDCVVAARSSFDQSLPASGVAWTALGARYLRGFDEPVELVGVVRRSLRAAA